MATARTCADRTLALCFLCALVGAWPGVAAGGINQSLSNFDVTNNTGQTANDFHVSYDYFNPADFVGFYTGDYPYATASMTGVDWTGATTGPGVTAHFGIRIQDDLDLSGVDMYWTFNGARIMPGGGGQTNTIPDVFQKWDWVEDPGLVRDTITNRSMQIAWVQRRINTSANVLGLADLMKGGLMWTTATLVDANPVQLILQSSLVYDFVSQANTKSYAMMYDVYADNGGVPGTYLMTYLNAAVVPEPMSLLLLAAGAVALVPRKR